MSYRLGIYSPTSASFQRYIYPDEEFFEIESFTLSPGGNCLEAIINGDARALGILPLAVVEIEILQGVTYQRWYTGRVAKNGNEEAYDPTQFKLIGLYDSLRGSVCTSEVIFSDDIATQALDAVSGATDLVSGLTPFVLVNSINFPDTTFTGAEIAPQRAAVGDILDALKEALQTNVYEWGVNASRQSFFRVPANIQVVDAEDLIEVDHREGDNDGVVTEVWIDLGDTSALGRITNADTAPITSPPISYKGKIHARKHFTLNDATPIPGTAYVGVLPLDLGWFDKQAGETSISVFNASAFSGVAANILDENTQTAWVLESNPEGITIDEVPDTKLFYIRIALATPAKVDGFYINMTRGVRWCWALSSKNRAPSSTDYSEFVTAGDGNIPWQTDSGFFWAPMEEVSSGKYLQLAIMVDMTPIISTAEVALDLPPHLSIYELYFIRANRALEDTARSFFVEPKQIPSRLVLKGLYAPSADVEFLLRDGSTLTLPTKSWQYSMTRENYQITYVDLEQAGDAEDVAAVEITKQREIKLSQQVVKTVRKDGSVSAQSVDWGRIQNLPRNLFPQETGGGGGGGGGFQGLTWTSDAASAVDSDPGSGHFRWNHATQSSATKLYLDAETKDLRDVQTHFANLFGLNPVGYIHLQQADDATRWQRWKYTKIESVSGYVKITVSLEVWSDVDIQDNKTVLFDFIPAGNGVLLYFPDAPPVVADAGSDEFDDGSVSGDWTAVNQSGLTLVITEGDHGLRMHNQNWLSNYYPVGLARAIGGDGTFYTTKVSLVGYAASGDYNLGAGILIWQDRTDSAGDVYFWGLQTTPTGNWLALLSWSAWNGTVSVVRESQALARGTHLYLRVRKVTDTSYRFDYSTDGVGWIRFYYLTTGFTPAHIGPGMYVHGNDAEGESTGFAYFRFWRTGTDNKLNAPLLGRKVYL